MHARRRHGAPPGSGRQPKLLWPPYGAAIIIRHETIDSFPTELNQSAVREVSQIQRAGAVSKSQGIVLDFAKSAESGRKEERRRCLSRHEQDNCFVLFRLQVPSRGQSDKNSVWAYQDQKHVWTTIRRSARPRLSGLLPCSRNSHTQICRWYQVETLCFETVTVVSSGHPDPQKKLQGNDRSSLPYSRNDCGLFQIAGRW